MDQNHQLDISGLKWIDVIPVGVTKAEFTSAIEEWTAILGAANVSKDEASGLLKYYDPWSLKTPDEHVPSAALRPTSVEHIQKILAVADKYSVPLWTISRGKNFGYGGSAPVVRGSVVLDLNLMNRIIEVNEEYAYAVVEPGVTFMELYAYIQERKLKLWMSTPALGWGSIVGNCLDRGFGYTPAGEHTQMQCGMEVVLPGGEIIRTGMGAMSSGSTFALYKGGYGPSVDGMFYQSNLGIVTKMGIWLQPQPETYMTCFVSVPKEEDLIPLVGTLSDLQRRNIIQNSPSIENPFRQAITQAMEPSVIALLGPHLGTKGAIPEPALMAIAQAHGWGYWKADFALYGPKAIVESSWAAIQAAFSPIPGAQCHGTLYTGTDGHPVSTADLPLEGIPHSGIPHLNNLALLEYRGKASGHTCFSPILPPSGRELYEWWLGAKKRTADAGFDFFADFHVFPRYVIAIDLVVFGADEAERCDALYRLLAHDAVHMGYSEYRTHVAYMDMIAGHFDQGGSALRRWVSGIKDVVDPKGVLAPGKQGVWGKVAGKRFGGSEF